MVQLWKYSKRLSLIVMILVIQLASQGHDGIFLVSAQEDATQTHTVQSGETLSIIAESYGIALRDLMKLNGIADPDAITVGQELLLPPVTQREATPSPLPTHTVQAGETLSEIAKQYGLTLTRLMLFNGIRDANAVYAGQTLQIPPALDEIVDETVENTPTTAPTEPPPSSPTPTTTPVPPMAEPTPTQAEESSVETVTEEASVPSESSEPETDTEVNSVPAEIDRTRLPTSLNRTYTVRAGDTLTKISLRNGVDFETLRRLNRIAPDQIGDLAAGQRLILPATGADLQVRIQEREYAVKPGDSLGSIANQFDLTQADLLAANRITNPDNIVVGQRLSIPGKVTENEKESNQVGPLRRGFYFYTVQAGDTVSELANAFGSTKLAILEYNGLPDEETVYSGLEIRVPYGPPALPDQRPPVPASGTSFLVSLSRQQCWLFHGDRVVYSWTCSTGYGDWITRVGSFSVLSKVENAQSSAYRLDMPYWLGIYTVGPYENGIHGLPVEWDTGKKIWERLIGEPATFGCAMLDDRDAAILFDLAYVGMPVHIIH
jgi:LysM repeat protein